MTAITLRAKPVDFRALEIVVGQTSKSEILAFCPGANVGANINDEYDLRWVVVPTPTGQADLTDGDYILRVGPPEGPANHFQHLTPADVNTLYEVVS